MAAHVGMDKTVPCLTAFICVHLRSSAVDFRSLLRRSYALDPKSLNPNPQILDPI
jgi:hypothetical protein